MKHRRFNITVWAYKAGPSQYTRFGNKNENKKTETIKVKCKQKFGQIR